MLLVSISPVGMAKFSNHPDFFIGTTFWGEEVCTIEELEQLVKQHAFFEDRWHPFQLGFMPAELKGAVKQRVDAGTTDLVEAFSVDIARDLRQTRFYGKCQKGWVVERKGVFTHHPEARLRDLLKEIGVELSE